MKLLSIFDLGEGISYISIKKNNFIYISSIYTLLLFVFSLFILAVGNNILMNLAPVQRTTSSEMYQQKNFRFILYAAFIALSGFLFMNAIVRLNTNISLFLSSFAFCFTLILLLILHFKEKTIKERNKLHAVVTEQLKKELEISNVSLLKNELEPHFIFNSLVALTHLIRTNPDSAIQFNYNLAFVYKYFLLNKNKNFISLDKELELVEKYFYLIQIRFENMISFKIDLEQEQLENIVIIPCTLQILIENAIKHNSFDADNPLQIEIMCKNNFLVITNNIKTKPLQIASTGIGLQNIITRYELIAKKYVQIQKEKNQFIVRVPVLKKEQV